MTCKILYLAQKYTKLQPALIITVFFFKFVRERTGSHHEINSNWSDELVLLKTKLSQNAFRQIAINDLLRKCDIIDDWWYRISANFRFNENMAHHNALLPAFNVKWIKHKIHKSNRVKTYSEQITLTGEYCYFLQKLVRWVESEHDVNPNGNFKFVLWEVTP